MGLLTDRDLEPLICSEKEWKDENKTIHIFPYDENCLTPVGYDVRVGSPCASSLSARLIRLTEGEKIKIRPGDTVLITTLESVSMPQERFLSAFITSKVSKVSKGLSHISTNIDPDWKGQLLIAIHNPSKNEVSLKYGESFCTINFIQNVSPSKKPCDKPPGRSEILLNNFLFDQQTIKIREEKQKLKNFKIKATVICAFAFAGYIVFQIDDFLSLQRHG